MQTARADFIPLLFPSSFLFSFPGRRPSHRESIEERTAQGLQEQVFSAPLSLLRRTDEGQARRLLRFFFLPPPTPPRAGFGFEGHPAY